MNKEKYQNEVESFVEHYIEKGYANAIYGNVNNKWINDFKERIYTLIHMAETNFSSLNQPDKENNVVEFHISGNTRFAERNGLVSFNFYYANEGLKLGDLYVSVDTNGKRFPIRDLKEIPTVKDAITITENDIIKDARFKPIIKRGCRIR